MSYVVPFHSTLGLQHLALVFCMLSHICGQIYNALVEQCCILLFMLVGLNGPMIMEFLCIQHSWAWFFLGCFACKSENPSVADSSNIPKLLKTPCLLFPGE
ncbi:unnamed protein product [Ilex paraguariensis]|uniref:Uncharacterized protein n=1 Tax=Ilex paraguariensis TaxID=185542 RepID=A0ABC8RDP0_9AQUA